MAVVCFVVFFLSVLPQYSFSGNCCCFFKESFHDGRFIFLSFFFHLFLDILQVEFVLIVVLFFFYFLFVSILTVEIVVLMALKSFSSFFPHFLKI